MAFLVFEGIDGSGKSTLLELLYNRLKQQRLPVVKTKEPGGTQIGENIRKLLLDRGNVRFSTLAETLLYYADRRQHIEEFIKPNLKKDITVISDRYWASTSAYQCGGRNISESFVEILRKQVCWDCEPDLWVLLDLPVEIALKRLYLSKKDTRDRMEMENSAFHQRVKDYYMNLATKDPSKWLVLSGEKASSVLLEELLAHLQKRNVF